VSRWELDIAKLALAVETVLTHRGLSSRKGAAEIGLSPSTLTRIKHGQKPDADGLIALLAWLKAEARDFTKETNP
jgi:transcriptional regulator with XRE-family HTH domain